MTQPVSPGAFWDSRVDRRGSFACLMPKPYVLDAIPPKPLNQS